MKRYFVNLTECLSDQAMTDLQCFGVNVVWASKVIDGFITVETDKTKEELENFFLIESANEEAEGTFSV